MNLTAGQLQGLEMAKRLKAAQGTVVGILGGFAGTGKTTLLKTIAETLGMPIVITPTGKAAARVKEAAGIGAMTAHRWMYEPFTNEATGKVEFGRKPPHLLSQGECGVIVIEEASMVTRDLWDHILDNARILGMKILCIGDPFQLPPVEERKDVNFSLLDPDAGVASEYVLMTEVLRQALESPVIRASMALRAGDVMGCISQLPQVKPKDFIEAGARVQARGGVIICHQNRTRHWCNTGIREVRRMPAHDIAPDEPILVLKNNYELQVYNGETHRFVDWLEAPMGKHTVFDKWANTRESTRLGLATLATEAGSFDAVLVVEELFGRLKANVRAIENTAKISFPDRAMVHANFGYTMTAHKAQGSEWEDVLIAWEPSLKFWGKFKEEALRWAYTSVTRARERCSISLGVTAPAEVK